MSKITLSMTKEEAAEFFAFTTVGIMNMKQTVREVKESGVDIPEDIKDVDIDGMARRAMELMKFALLTAAMSDDE